MEPPSRLLPKASDEQGLDTGMNILEPVVERRLGYPVVIDPEKGGKELFCRMVGEDPLLVEHEYMRHVHQDICIGDTPVRPHGGEEMHHLAGSLPGKTPSPNNVALRRIHNLA